MLTKVLPVSLVLLLVGHTTRGDTGYVGVEACGRCHPEIYAHYVKTGHAYVVNKVEGWSRPSYPFSSVLEPPKGYTWENISYVLGGYGWKARFLDRNGYLITGEKAQFNLATGEWVAFHPEQAPGTQSYDCADCHTTGWRTSAENGGVHQDSLKGIPGTWEAPGVQCERCHGPGNQHQAMEGDKGWILKDTTAELCGQCHYVNGQPRMEAQEGLILSEQYDQLINSPHHTLTCVTCHDPHRSTKYNLGGIKTPTCTNCHADRVVCIPEMADVSCVNCHMPLAAISEGTTGKGSLGNMHSHTFKLNADPEVRMFSDDGELVRVDSSGNAVVEMTFACLGCHNDVDASTRNKAWMYRNGLRIHRCR